MIITLIVSSIKSMRQTTVVKEWLPGFCWK